MQSYFCPELGQRFTPYHIIEFQALSLKVETCHGTPSSAFCSDLNNHTVLRLGDLTIVSWGLWRMQPQQLRYIVYSVLLRGGKRLYGSGNNPFGMNFTR